MSIIGMMINKMVIQRFLAILIAVTLFILTLEIVTYSKEILALKPGHLSIVGEYLMLRAPATMSTFLPLSLLLALLLSLTELSYRNETVVIWAAGLSPLQLVVMIAPVAVLAGVLNFLLNDRAMPYAAPTLRDWGIADYGEKRFKVGEKDPLWLRSGSDIVRAGSATLDSSILTNVIIFRRGSDGLLLQQIYADRAERNEAGWKLANVSIMDVSETQPRKAQELLYSGVTQPAAAGSRSGDPEEMTINDIQYFIDNFGFGIRPTYVYSTWWHKRVTLLFSSFVIVGMCIPLAAGFRRGGGLGALFAVGAGLGFLYFVVDGILLTMGEIGMIVPWLAAWLPNIVFGTLAILLLLKREQLTA